VEQTVALVLHHKHVALIGSGGIGKTSISKTVLNDPAILDYFGDDRRFVGCDGFAVSLEAFILRCAQVVGAIITSNNPLSTLMTFLTSRTAPLLIVLDSAESVLDTGGNESQAEIMATIEEFASCKYVSSSLQPGPPSFPTT